MAPTRTPVSSVAAATLQRLSIIEDSEVYFEMLALRLRLHYPSLQAVQWLSDPTTVLQEVASFGPDLVITDYHMPGYDVLTTLGALRQRWPKLPLLVMSGRVGEERAVQLLKAGANDFLSKSNSERLPMVIDRELAEAQALRAREELQHQFEGQRLFNQAIVEQVPVGLWMLSPQGGVEGANRRGAQLMDSLGSLDRDGAWSATACWVDNGEPVGARDWPGAIALEQREQVPPRLMRVLDRDGAERFLSCGAAPLSAEDTGSLGAVVTAVDMTSEMQLQERLRRTEERLRDLSLHHIELQEQQVARLSRELHDNLGQVLSLLKMHLSTAARRELPPRRRDMEIDQALPLVDLALGRLREVCGDLWPSELSDFGLGPALAGVCEAAARAGNIEATATQIGQPQPLAASKLLGLFRVGQQAVTNTLSHASASKLSLELRWTATDAVLLVSDDGAGFDVSAARSAQQQGLRGMYERMELLGGCVDVVSRAGRGTAVCASVPTATQGRA